MHGGAGAFVEKLQAFFDTGRFVMWNEPDMATPYLFTHFPGESWRTQEQVRAAMEQYFSAEPHGLPGNDDAGTLSAWYVFSAMGFYPDPGSTRYSLGSPLFDRVEISLSPNYHGGKRFVISAPRTGDDQIYVTDMILGGKPHNTASLTHEQITAGGTLELTLSAQR